MRSHAYVLIGIAFLTFHDAQGGLIRFIIGSDDTVIVSPAPYGFNAKTLIQSGAGQILVRESPDVVAQEIEQLRDAERAAKGTK